MSSMSLRWLRSGWSRHLHCSMQKSAVVYAKHSTASRSDQVRLTTPRSNSGRLIAILTIMEHSSQEDKVKYDSIVALFHALSSASVCSLTASG